MFCGVEMSQHKKRVAESAYNVFIEEFSKAGNGKNQRRDFFIWK
jgi:hypothetical protein